MITYRQKLTLASESQAVLDRLAEEHDEVSSCDDDSETLKSKLFAEGRTRSATVQVRVNQPLL